MSIGGLRGADFWGRTSAVPAFSRARLPPKLRSLEPPVGLRAPSHPIGCGNGRSSPWTSVPSGEIEAVRSQPAWLAISMAQMEAELAALREEVAELREQVERVLRLVE